ncbi:hypothetical protein BLNAU_22703 [Blattamonas nauphoetae]|uniref:Uncharacterized protein n=1 Tax=Blattamonas nauphoetae TaxID=2049346 RepID=A0ABQ9WSB7_9EUKA|nr:hypothetical protein BLNAU_22703 [Blattamonas nauphoetae]
MPTRSNKTIAPSRRLEKSEIESTRSTGTVRENHPLLMLVELYIFSKILIILSAFEDQKEYPLITQILSRAPRPRPNTLSTGSNSTLSSLSPIPNNTTCIPPKSPSGVDQCAFVKANCQEEVEGALFPHLFLRYCGLNRAPWLYYVVMILIIIIIFFLKVSNTLTFLVPPLGRF